jgi:hypothetical protein
MSVSLYGSGQTVLQVASTTLSTSFSSTSSSLTPVTGLSVSITPQSTTSKILVFYSVGLSSTRDADAWFTLFRNSTQLSIGSGGTINASGKARASSYTDAITQGMSGVYLDSPSTTSSITYQIQVATNSTVYVNTTVYNPANIYTPSSITVLEISGS